MRLFVVLAIAAAPALSIAAEQDFFGYRCSGQCEGHKYGWDWALANGVKSREACYRSDQSFSEGCWAFVSQSVNGAAPAGVERRSVFRYEQDGVTFYSSSPPSDAEAVVVMTGVFLPDSLASWASLGAAEDGSEFLIEASPSKSTRGDIREVWVLESRTDRSYLTEARAWWFSVASLTEINCANRRSRVTSQTFYAGPYATRDAVASYSVSAPPHRPMPGTFGALIVDKACAEEGAHAPPVGP